MDNAGAASSTEPWVCPFLRGVAADGSLGAAIRWPDAVNRCVAIGDPAPQSLRQQEYACLASAHVNCPRFIRGVEAMADAPGAPTGTGLPVTPAIIAALLVLAASFALSIGFVVANGGMDLTAAATPQAGLVSGAPSPVGSGAPAAASDQPATSTAPSAEPGPSASIDSATTPPSPTPLPSPSAAVTPRPSSDRYALLHPCPDAVDCWIYVIRSGDNLVSIARYFGVPMTVVTQLNPWTETTPLVAGQELRLPPPTR
jgi:hypothetical protein